MHRTPASKACDSQHGHASLELGSCTNGLHAVDAAVMLVLASPHSSPAACSRWTPVCLSSPSCSTCMLHLLPMCTSLLLHHPPCTSSVCGALQIDLDTIETSNLNRQFLFRQHHVGKSKALVAAEVVTSFAPDAKITAYQVGRFPAAAVVHIIFLALVVGGLLPA